MPKSKYKKKKGPGWLVLLLLPMFCWGYLPHQGKTTEFRIVGSSEDFSDYSIHGQVVGGSVLHPDIKIAGLLEMNQAESNMKGLVEYHLNDFVRLGVSAGMTNKGSALGEFLITGMIPGGSLDFLPFLKVTHQAIGEVGIVVYLNINKVVFNFGGSYQPAIPNHQGQKFNLMIGTGIKSS